MSDASNDNKPHYDDGLADAWSAVVIIAVLVATAVYWVSSLG